VIVGGVIVGGVIVGSLAARLYRKSRKKSFNNSKQAASRPTPSSAAPETAFQRLGRMWVDIRPSIQPLQLWVGASATVLRVSAKVLDVAAGIATKVRDVIDVIDDCIDHFREHDVEEVRLQQLDLLPQTTNDPEWIRPPFLKRSHPYNRDAIPAFVS